MNALLRIFYPKKSSRILTARKISILASRKYGVFRFIGLTLSSLAIYTIVYISITLLVVYLSDSRTMESYSYSAGATNNSWDQAFDFLNQLWKTQIIFSGSGRGTLLNFSAIPSFGNSMISFSITMAVSLVLILPFFYMLERTINRKWQKGIYTFFVKIMLFVPSVLIYIGLIASSDNITGKFSLSFDFNTPSTWVLPIFIQALPITALLLNIIDIFRKHTKDTHSSNLLNGLRIKKLKAYESYVKIKINSVFLGKNILISIFGAFVLQLVFEAAIDYPGFGTLVRNVIFSGDIWITTTILLWFVFVLLSMLFLIRFAERYKKIIGSYEK